MNKSNIKNETGEIETPQKFNRLPKISMWLGILAVVPYVCGFLFYWWHDLFFSDFSSFPSNPVRLVQSILGSTSLLGAICGFPFGLAGIITGGIGLFKQPRTKKNAVFALIGIILGIGGLIGHYWYIASCQFCQ